MDNEAHNILQLLVFGLYADDMEQPLSNLPIKKTLYDI